MTRKILKILPLLTLIFGVIFFTVFSLPVYAQNMNNLTENLITNTPLLKTDLLDLVFKIIRYVLAFLGVVAVVILIYGGFVWMTARGNDERVNKAKKIIVNGLVGLIVILLSYAIVSFVIGPILGLGGPGGGGPGGGGPGGGLPSGANYLVITSRYPKSGETIPRNSKIIITFNQNLQESSIKLALPKEGDPSKTSCVDDNNNPTWNIAIQDGNNNYIDGSVQVNGNTLIFTPTSERCDENHNNLPCEIASKEDCKQNFTNNKCCGCFVNDDDYKISLIAYRGLNNYVGIKGTRDDTNKLYKDEIWNFNVGNYYDDASPEVETNLPQGNNVPRNSAILVTFSKEIDLTTLTLYNPQCVRGSANCTLENCGANNCLDYAVNTPDLATIKIYEVDGNGAPIPDSYIKGFFERFSTKTFIFRPSAVCEEPNQTCRCLPGLDPNQPDKKIRVELVNKGNNVIRDTHCNSLKCDNGKCVWDFKTSANIDLDPPQIINNYPVNNAQDIDRLLEINATFNEIVDPTSVNEDTFILSPSTAAKEIRVDSDITSIFVPNKILDPQKKYTPMIYGGGREQGSCQLDPDMSSYGVKDLAGNTMVNNYTWSFTTGWTINDGDPYIDRVTPGEGPHGQCVTVHGYNLGCCVSSSCSNILEAQQKKIITSRQNNQVLKTCNVANQPGESFMWGDSDYIVAETLSWLEINKPEKCLNGKCPTNCTKNTCDKDLNGNVCAECIYCSDPNGCGSCYCPMPPNYSPENEIILVVPDGAENRQPSGPSEIKIVPAY